MKLSFSFLTSASMQPLLYKILFVLWIFILALVFTGGGVLHVPFRESGFKLELSQVDPFGLLFILLLGWYYRQYQNVPVFLSRAESFFTKHAVLFFWGVFSLAFVAHSLKNLTFQTNAFDQSFIHQTLFTGNCGLCKSNIYLGEHLSFTLWLLRPLGALFQFFASRDYLVYFLQILLMGVGVQTFLKRNSYYAYALLWWICLKPIRQSLVWDLREDLLGLLFAFALISISEVKKWSLKNALFFIFFGFAFLLTKEIYFLGLLLMLPVIYFLWKDSFSFSKKLVMFFLFLAGLSYSFFSFNVLIPYFSGALEQTNEIAKRLPGLGNTPREILENILFHPLQSLKILLPLVLGKSQLKYIFALFIPVSPFLLKSKNWLYLLPALPFIFINLISKAETQRSLQFHYELVFMPFFLWLFLKGNLKQVRVALLLAFCFSGRWPMLGITQSLSKLNVAQIQDVNFLNTLKPEINVPIVGSLMSLAHVSHFPQIKLLNGDLTGLMHTSEQSSGLNSRPEKAWWIIHKQSAEEVSVLEKNFSMLKLIQTSPSGHFEIYEKK